MANKLQTIKNGKFSQVLYEKLWLTFATFFFQNNYKELNITFFIKYSNKKVSKSHKENIDRKDFQKPFQVVGNEVLWLMLKKQLLKEEQDKWLKLSKNEVL